ncbi:unnamed protein product [marine sediment metagenome]|uniref:Uncharacterized protein n=1 Tax=marine sediment metagenome TaxID=412755 RepID=X1SZ86_9ZZZZ
MVKKSIILSPDSVSPEKIVEIIKRLEATRGELEKAKLIEERNFV